MAVIGKAVSAIFGGGGGATPAASPTVVNIPQPEQAAASQSPLGSRGGGRGQGQASFLSGASAPNGSIGSTGKTLLGA